MWAPLRKGYNPRQSEIRRSWYSVCKCSIITLFSASYLQRSPYPYLLLVHLNPKSFVGFFFFNPVQKLNLKIGEGNLPGCATGNCFKKLSTILPIFSPTFHLISRGNWRSQFLDLQDILQHESFCFSHCQQRIWLSGSAESVPFIHLFSSFQKFAISSSSSLSLCLFKNIPLLSF